jgi:release factor glutamine methyltransferase
VSYETSLEAGARGTLPYQAALAEAVSVLAGAGLEQPRREARLLLAHLLQLPERALPPDTAQIDRAALHEVLRRRAAFEPLAYITGQRGFWSFEVAVSPATLIPRPDSEALVQTALSLWPNRAAVRRILDLGTGTGCLLLAGLLEFPAAFGVGVDLVPQAACLARANALRLGLDARCAFLAADWGQALRGRFDVVFCNPPYIDTADMAGLMRDVIGYEPASALDGGQGGLREYARLIPAVAGLLSPGGTAILELGAGQSETVTELARAAGFSEMETQRDLAGITRVLVMHAPR